MERIVLAYSGGPRSSAAIPWLLESDAHRSRHDEVVAVTVDLGQRVVLEGVRHRAMASGATRAHVLDRREAYVRRFLLPVIQSGAAARSLGGDDHASVAEAIGRALIAQALVEIAHIEGASAVAHAAAGAKDRARIAAAVGTLDRALRVVSVTADWPFGAAGPAFETFAKAHGIPVADDAVAARPTSSEPVFVTLEFRAGVPVAANGVEMDLIELPESLEIIAAAQGVSGIAALADAHGAVQRRVQPAALAASMDAKRHEYAMLVDSGRWFTPERQEIDAAMAALQADVTGAARLKLLNGTCEVIDSVQ